MGARRGKPLPARLRRRRPVEEPLRLHVEYVRTVSLRYPDGLLVPVSEDEQVTTCRRCHRAVKLEHVSPQGHCALCAPRRWRPAHVVRDIGMLEELAASLGAALARVEQLRAKWS